jgi:alkylated DNA repair protein (DNA oxidative demethylase)
MQLGSGRAGVEYHRGLLDRATQEALASDVLRVVEQAPFYTPIMPKTGAAMSVQQTNLGPLGWVTDQARGYRYEPAHPETGHAWPAIPQALLDLWEELTAWPAPPQACLVNFYGPGAKMGLHVDSDEVAKDAPVLSVSLGDSAIFRVGGPTRKHPTQAMTLHSGDVVVLGGEARRYYHGVDRILAGSSRLIPGGGRINLTLRRVTA